MSNKQANSGNIKGGFQSLVVSIAFLAGPAFSDANRSLLHIPSPEILPMGGLSIATDVRGFMDYKSGETSGLPKMRTGFSFNYGFMEFVQAGLTIYSNDNDFRLTSGQVQVHILKEGNIMPSLGIGAMDITGNRHPVEFSGFPVTGTDYSRYAENNSWYFVARKGLLSLAEVYAGVGAGRFRGRGPQNKKFQGAFGGGELKVIGPVKLLGEMDGRNVNAGVGVSLGTLRPGHNLDISLNASAWAMYLQNMRQASKDIGLSPAYSGKLDISMVLPSIRVKKTGGEAEESLDLSDAGTVKEAIPEMEPVVRGLLHIPSTEVLPAGAMGIATDIRGFMDYKTGETSGLPKMRTGVAVNYGFLDVLEAGITVYSNDPGFHLASGQVKIKMLDEGDYYPSLAGGFMDITGARHPVEYSGYPITLSAYDRHAENKSLYVVARRSLPFVGNVYAGIGGGRFKGYGPKNSKLMGAFGGAEINLPGPVFLLGEMDGRNANAGLGVMLGKLRPGHVMDVSVNASVWGMYLQNTRKASEEIGLRPAISGKIDIAMILPALEFKTAETKMAETEARKAGAYNPVVLRPKTMEFNNPVSDWNINITDPKGKVIRSFQGVGLPPSVFEWDGLDGEGGAAGARPGIKMELTVRDIAGVEKMDVVPIGGVTAPAADPVEAAVTEYGKAVASMMNWKTDPTTRLKALAGKAGPDGKATMAQVRANELLAFLSRKAGKPNEARQYALKALFLARQGGLATFFKNPERDNLWNLAGKLLGDYRLWPLLYEANMDTMKGPREAVPAGRTIRVPNAVLEEDYGRFSMMFMETTPPEGFNPARKAETEEPEE